MSLENERIGPTVSPEIDEFIKRGVRANSRSGGNRFGSERIDRLTCIVNLSRRCHLDLTSVNC